MEEVKQSLQETASKERKVINRCSLKTVGLQPSKRVHKRRYKNVSFRL